MHIESALISTAVATTLAATQAAVLGYTINKERSRIDSHKLLKMAAYGALIYALQMIDVAIPGTGTSGHLLGGVLLAVLLGREAAFITMSAVLIIQAFLFGDGGILALGCNLLNMAFIPSFIVYPLIYKPMVKKLGSGLYWNSIAITLSSVVAIGLAALGATLEISFSGIAPLNVTTFISYMLPVHMLIGLGEGIVTTLLLSGAQTTSSQFQLAPKYALLSALLFGGVISLFTSSAPDGLNWALAQATAQEYTLIPQGLHLAVEPLQQLTSLLPDALHHTFGVVAARSFEGIIGSLIVFGFMYMIGRMLSVKTSIQSLIQ